MDFVILLPDSQRKNPTHTHKAQPLSHITTQLLADISKQDPKKVYSARIQEATKLNSNLETCKTRPAITRYAGVVYQALDYETLQNKQYIDERLRIVSPMYGILNAQDLIGNYKLSITKMQAYKRFYEYNTKHLKGLFCIDLLPQAHKKSLSYDDGVEIQFTREKNGKIRKAGHAGKKIKGKFVRWLAEHNITELNDMYDFSEDGYEWNGETFHKSE